MSHAARRHLNAGLFALVAFIATVIVYWLILSFFGTLHARADVLTPPLDEGVVASELWAAIRFGNGWLAAASALSLSVLVIRKYGLTRMPDRGRIGAMKAFLLSDAGGVVFTFMLALLGGAAHGIKAGMPFGWEFIEVVLKVGFGAIGGFVGVKKVLFGKPYEPPATSEPSTPPPAGG